MLVWIYWILSLTIVTYASVQIVKRYPQYGFAALTGFYVVYLAASQVVATRVITFDLGFYVFFAPAAVFIYPFVAQVIDMINEVYGKTMAHVAIGIAFISQVLLVIFFIMVNSLTPAPFYTNEIAWQEIFGMSIRITLASWISFLICSTIDASVFAGLKQRFLNKEINFKHHSMLNPYVWLRSSVSDAISLTLDSVIFVTIAFWGVMPVLPLIIGQIVSKNIIGFIDNPWFVWYKYMLKKDDVSLSGSSITRK
jgi:uncharacterized integral membrane protein (TIGR00697 family)